MNAIIQQINRVINQAVKDGGDWGGAYNTNPKGLRQSMEDLLSVMEITDYAVQEVQGISTKLMFMPVENGEKK